MASIVKKFFLLSFLIASFSGVVSANDGDDMGAGDEEMNSPQMPMGGAAEDMVVPAEEESEPVEAVDSNVEAEEF